LKVAIVSFDHIDCGISLAKYLAEIRGLSIDLYLVFSQKYRSVSIVNLEKFELRNGLLKKELSDNLIGSEINNYMENRFNCRIFLYKSASIYDAANFYLSYRFAQSLKAEKYDLIHFNGTSGFMVFLHYFLRKVPRINTVHDPSPHTGESSWINSVVFKLLFRHKIGYILHSEVLVNEFISRYNVNAASVYKVYYGPLEIYHYFNHEKIHAENRTVLFFGRISPYKGIEYLIDAAKIVRKKVSGLKVIIAGRGDLHFDVRDVMMDETFTFVNRYIPNDELVSFIKKASIVICPYTDATQSGVVMTALAFNKPVIASEVGGLPEIIEHDITGKLVPPKDVAALADAMLDLLVHSDKLERMQRNIRKKCQSEELSWGYIAHRTYEIYQNFA